MLLGSSAMGIVSPTIPFFLKAAASAQQVLKVIQQNDKLDEQVGAKITLDRRRVVGNLSLSEVTFCYPQRPTTTVLDVLSLDIPANKTTAVVGPSGCGKSTIVGLIERWYKSTEGSILLDGVDLEQINVSSLRDQMGLVQQVLLTYYLLFTG
jgi:ATP-binding cassette, subfamily B (MDR/TAP), member 1